MIPIRLTRRHFNVTIGSCPLGGEGVGDVRLSRYLLEDGWSDFNHLVYSFPIPSGSARAKPLLAPLPWGPGRG